MKSALFAVVLSLSSLSPALAADSEPALLEEAAARLACGPMRLVSTDGRNCTVSFFPDRVGARARFACGVNVFACVCTETGPECERETR